MISAWWASLTLSMKILWGITLSSSLVFIIQSIMTFIGADAGDSGLDADFDGSFDGNLDTDAGALDHTSAADAASATGMNLLTFRNLINFLLGFGWSAILLKENITSVALLLTVSVLVGIGLVAAVMYMFKWLSGMQQSGNINLYKSAVGCQGKVYLTIPGHRDGQGKVQISINGAIREYDAMTEGDTLKTGLSINVVEVIDAGTVLVEPADSLII